jgi:hypothetical protein
VFTSRWSLIGSKNGPAKPIRKFLLEPGSTPIDGAEASRVGGIAWCSLLNGLTPYSVDVVLQNNVSNLNHSAGDFRGILLRPIGPNHPVPEIFSLPLFHSGHCIETWDTNISDLCLYFLTLISGLNWKRGPPPDKPLKDRRWLFSSIYGLMKSIALHCICQNPNPNSRG